MNGFERVKEKKKRAIKDAALSLFTEHGYKDVKIEDIAKEANVSQVTIYNHFGSKETLFREIMKEMTKLAFQHYQEIIQEKISFQEKITKIMVQKIQQVNRFHPDMLEQALQKDIELQTFLYTYQKEEIIPWFLTFIEEAQYSGDVNPNLSKDMILLYMDMFTKLSEMYSTQILQSENRDEQTKELMTLFFYGLSTPK